MLQTLKNAWKTKDIRSKIIFTLFILVLYRIGTVIPVPFVNASNFASSFSGTILDYMNTLSGGSLGAMTLFALGVSPYINASIIIQLLAIVFPKLGELAKEDKKKMNFITRIVTVVLAIVTAVGYYFLLKNGNSAYGIDTYLTHSATGKMAWLYAIVIVACYTAGACLIMWLAERINEKGIGNGISLILFANIISSVPSFVYNLATLVIGTYSYTKSAWLYALVSTVFAIVFIAGLLALIFGVRGMAAEMKSSDLSWQQERFEKNVKSRMATRLKSYRKEGKAELKIEACFRFHCKKSRFPLLYQRCQQDTEVHDDMPPP